MTCDYCDSTTYHACIQRDKAKVLELANRLTERYGQGKEDRTPVTSDDLRRRSNARQDIARSIKQQGFKIKPEYDLEIK
jgi:hypothetical protein